jgi:hypothetical protein
MEVLYKHYSFRPYQLTNMAATGKSCFLLVCKLKLEAQWAEPVSLTFHCALRKFNVEPPTDPSHLISVHFSKAVSDKKTFRN